MSNNKQSSVEWLFDNLNLCFDKFDNGEYSYTEFVNASNEIKEQAKTMHKEEIIEAHRVQYDYSHSQIDPKKVTGEQYYNETFGGNNEQQ